MNAETRSRKWLLANEERGGALFEQIVVGGWSLVEAGAAHGISGPRARAILVRYCRELGIEQPFIRRLRRSIPPGLVERPQSGVHA